MLLKILLAVLGLALIGVALLSLQQQQLLMAHAMSDLHVQMDQDRKDTWDAQAAIAERSHPVALRQAVERVGLELEALPTVGGAGEPTLAWPDPARFVHAPNLVEPLRDLDEAATAAEAAEAQPLVNESLTLEPQVDPAAGEARP